jgi:acyl-CoA thioesterase-1
VIGRLALLSLFSVNLGLARAAPDSARQASAGATPTSAPTVDGKPRAQPGSRRVLLVLGDSLSAEYGLARGSGWVALMTQRLSARSPDWEVVNASISGETTAGGRTRLPELLARHKPHIVAIELGANDALRGLPLASTEGHLKDMVRLSKEAGARPMLIGMQVPPNYGKAYTEAFAALFKRLAEAQQIPWVPFLMEGFADRQEFFQADRIHPNEQAQSRMLETVWPVVSRMLSAR